MKTILDLPEDLVEDEIISRLPMTSLRTVRSTCRKWNTECKNRILFGKEAAAKKQFMMMDSRRICLMNLDLPKDNGDPSVEQVLDQIQISKVFQCDGLLLCFLMDCSRLLVWNPYLGQTRWIEPRHSFQHGDSFALGYNNNLNHKILRFSNEVHPITSFFDCFDFTTESFGPLLPLPPFHSYHGLHFTSFSCVRQDKLAVLHQHWELCRTIQISLTDKIGPNINKRDILITCEFHIRLLELDVVTGFWVNPYSGSFFIDEEKKIAVVFVLETVKACRYQTAHVIGQNGYFKSVRIREAPYVQNSYPHNRSYLPLLCYSYLPSLVQL
ncbi:BnaAnng07480D [Brassica napus]|uniref:BnaAnng07480D protein n=1 Tax=Brassica napus TaxID=3708 RepID=A0A078I3N8_BRANA|nr:BnaAnng07480D [Brassica napus]